MTLQEIQNIISLQIKEKKMDFFCGAGISYNSGLPLAIPMLKKTLQELGATNIEQEEIIKSSLPFEAFFETIFENVDNPNFKEFIEIFKVGKPCQNHKFLAYLSKEGYAKKLFTTNFDELIEKALIQNNLQYIVKKSEDDFQKQKENNLQVIKLHGSTCDYPSIAITLNAVANQNITANRKLQIQEAFLKNDSESLLIMGYSFSDIFDITPCLLTLSGMKKTLFIVDHIITSKTNIIPLKSDNKYDAVKDFNGYRIECNTDEFVNLLWVGLNDGNIEFLSTPNHSFKDNEWNFLLCRWANNTLLWKSLKHYLVAKVLAQIGRFSLAETRLQSSLQEARKENFPIAEGRALLDLANVYRNIGQFKKGLEYGIAALRISEQYQNEVGQTVCNQVAGDCLRNLRQFNEAIKYYNKGLQIAEKINKPALVAGHLNALGLTHLSLKDYEKALDVFTNFHKIVEEMGNIKQKGYALGNLGLINRKLNRLPEARKYYNQTIVIAQQLGDLKLLYNNFTNIAYISELSEALVFYNKSLEVAYTINDNFFIGRALFNLGNAKHQNGNINDGLSLMLQSYNLLKEILPADDLFLSEIKGVINQASSY